MSQLPLFSMQPPTWTVTEITQHIRDLFETDDALQDVWVLGEVSNCSRPSSGHLYFTLKDKSCALKCVMWRTSAVRQAFLPRDGDMVEAHGSLGVYEVNGVYQLYADQIRPSGEGLLYQEFLRLKARLEAEGLFDPDRKRPIPRLPHRIGIVTSPTGAALRDMLNTLRRRYPLVEVVLAPTAVQGDEAPDGIVYALERLNRLACPDVIILARGGGSMEDLWAFNDEQVARSIAASRAPVISGVGHETDFTIADFVADLRAPTPTAAAELATPNREDLLATLRDVASQLNRAAASLTGDYRWRLSTIQSRLRMRSPELRLRSDRQRLDDMARRLGTRLAHRFQLEHVRLAALQQRLGVLSPQAVLGRGYARVMTPDGQLVSSVQQVQPEDLLRIQVSDGEFNAQVK